MCEANPSSPRLLQNHLLQLLFVHFITELQFDKPQYEHAWAGHYYGIEAVEDLSESSSESDLWYSYCM